MSGGKWLKGVSGNPLGRPKGATTLDGVRAFRKYEVDIFKAYQSLLVDPDGRVRAKGVELGLAYLFGKPAESQAPAPASSLTMTWTPDQLAAAESQLEPSGSEGEAGSVPDPATDSDPSVGNGAP